jgi:hypothetical protein
MSWNPSATKLELRPESDTQAAIRPTQLIIHSVAAPWTGRRTYEYWRDSTNLESHFYVEYGGGLYQFIGTETRADANYNANRRDDGTGAVSIETASNTSGTDAWTPEQMEKLILLGVWLHRTHGIPLRICRAADDPGIGYHRMYADWSPSGTNCPGAARVKQFHNTVFPGIVSRATEEIDMTPEQAAQLKSVFERQNVAPWTYKNEALETRDAYGILRDIDKRLRAIAAEMQA